MSLLYSPWWHILVTGFVLNLLCYRYTLRRIYEDSGQLTGEDFCCGWLLAIPCVVLWGVTDVIDIIGHDRTLRLVLGESKEHKRKRLQQEHETRANAVGMEP